MIYNIIKNITSPLILFCISGLFIFLNMIRKNNNFFDLRGVIKGHYNIFKGNRIQQLNFLVIPLLLSYAILQIKFIDKDIINNINIVLSIFLSMFFAILSILCSLPKKSGVSDDYNKLAKETFNTVMFECILCILILVISFIVLFINVFESSLSIKITSFIIYYLILVVILNIFIVIKRLKVLFDAR